MAGRTDNSVFIDAPVDLVWRMTNDVRSWPSLFTEYADTEILREEGGTVTFRLTTHPDPDGAVWSWVSERTPDPVTRTVFAQRVDTGPFEFMKIYWDYTEEAGGTRMRWRQEFAARADGPFTTEALTSRINTNTVIQMAAIKDRVEAVAAMPKAEVLR